MSRIVVALDNLSHDMSMQIARQVSGHVWGFKVNDLLMKFGVSIIGELARFGKVFADPKLFDIPNTVGNTVKVLTQAGADLITCHAAGGLEMLQKAVEVGGDRILAVTVLTSMSNEEILAIYGNEMGRGDLVHGFSRIAQKAKCWGVVCAADDIALIPAGVRTVVPGFRPNGLVEGDDQKNVGGFKEAGSANLIVVGRPVTGSRSPLDVVKSYNKELEGK